MRSNAKAKTNAKADSSGFWGETIQTLFIALILAFLLRTLLFQPFHIPSGSMEPTLYKGDYIITTKYSLGYGKYAASPFKLPVKKGRIFERKPKQGDIIVFKPIGSKLHYIKRLVGLPGDKVQMIGGTLHVNGEKIKTQEVADTARRDANGDLVRSQHYKEFFREAIRPHMIQDLEKNGEADDTGVYSVPAGHYFFMGDNRDDSYDSRFPVSVAGVGYVPAENLVGRAEFILLSVGEDFKLIKPWTWVHIRGNRFLKGL